MNEIKIRKRGSRRIAALGSGGAAVAVMMLMVLAPMSAGATIFLPVKKFGASVQYGASTGACAKAKQLVAPHWTPLSGMFKTAGTTSAPKCAPSASTNFGSWNGAVDLTSFVHFKVNGSYTITTAWKIIAHLIWAQTPYTSCALNYKAAYSSCITGASTEVFGYSYLYDQSNSSYAGYGINFGTFVTLYNSSYTQNYSQNYCYAGTCTHYGGNSTSPGPTSGSFTGTVMLNSTIAATGANSVNNHDIYEIIVVLYAFADAQASIQNAKATGVGSASATVNLGTLGFGAQLVSVSYS